MKVLVTGAGGQLGSDVMSELKARGHEAVGMDIGDMNITDAESVNRAFSAFRPQAVVHCAAWTAVDAAEDAANVQKVYEINVNGSANVANACKECGSKMVYISTDYVFDGSGTSPWKPDCDSYAPLSVYGKSKLEGEKAVRAILEKFFIVRTSWAFGCHGGNFVKTMLKLGCSNGSLRVVDDQIGSPTYTPDLARLLADMIETDKYGCYHATNEGEYISWAAFAREIFARAGLNTRVIPVTTEEYGSKALRPKNSRLDKSKLTEKGFKRLPDWREALDKYLAVAGKADGD